jgi:hypothetical protein
MWNLRPGCKIIDDKIKQRVHSVINLELLTASKKGQINEIVDESGITISTRFRIRKMEVGTQ